MKDLPDDTVLDGELVALDTAGHADFNMLQNFKSAEHHIHYYAFDVLVHRGKILIDRPLSERRAVLAKILPRNGHISLSAVGPSASQMLEFVKQNGLGGVRQAG